MGPSALALHTLTELSKTDSPFAADAGRVVYQWENHNDMHPQAFINLSLQTSRLVKIAASGHTQDAALFDTYMNTAPKTWSANSVPVLPAAELPQQRLAQQMLGQLRMHPTNQLPNACLRITAAAEARVSTLAAVAHCQQAGIDLDLQTEDPLFDTALVAALNDEQIDKLAAYNEKNYEPVTHHLTMRSQISEAAQAGRDPEKFKRLEQGDLAGRRRRSNDDVRWILTIIPTEADATRDGMEYGDYLNFFFESCDQPWDEIKLAQKKLIGRFNQAKELRVTNDDGTDIRMSLVGHTFANSVVARNMPGSEIFSGPVKESVNGRIVAKGNFSETLDGVTYHMRDLTLEVKNGRVVKGTAAEGQEGLDTILSYDDHRDPSDPKFEGSRHFGEIGIGTNSFIRQHLVNPLLVEKISGSFHMALGNAYGDSYLGKPVYMANGNKSDMHWDITTMLRGHGGRMYLDGHLIQKDGEWIANGPLRIKEKDVAVLNKGWAALPAWKRPGNFSAPLSHRDRLCAESPGEEKGEPKHDTRSNERFGTNEPSKKARLRSDSALGFMR